jgi:hypothetical protein
VAERRAGRGLGELPNELQLWVISVSRFSDFYSLGTI